MSRFSGLESPRAGIAADVGFVRRVVPMFLRGLLRKPLLGKSAGPLFVGRNARLSNLGRIRHDGRLVIEDGAEVQGLARRGLRFGSDVSIGPGSMIRPSSYYGGEVGEGLLMGDRSSTGANCFIGCSGRIEIGNDVMLGPGVRIFSENHAFEDTAASIKSQGVVRGTVVIGDDCWIASGATITANVTIGRGVVVAAGSVVTSDVPDNAVVAGIPAKILRYRA
ncbi:acyltransferase [Planctomonas psychrotolerans]|uniref:acyltransferase n=1 Tax=Planctomonas psychrotolerans TaxID=2528712 RepID=UPI00123844AF|nr:acyltransferase [Planctomonas psychrotolerans]